MPCDICSAGVVYVDKSAVYENAVVVFIISVVVVSVGRRCAGRLPACRTAGRWRVGPWAAGVLGEAAGVSVDVVGPAGVALFCSRG